VERDSNRKEKGRLGDLIREGYEAVDSMERGETELEWDGSRRLNQLRDKAHANSVAKGFWAPKEVQGAQIQPTFGESIALVHSEATEALEEYRDGHEPTEIYHAATSHPEVAPETGILYGWKPEGIPIELADVIIRVLDICGHYAIDIERAVALKMAYNSTRPYQHGGKLL
jgi:NTP pyrophosphatase (non-canonical NTP hydrolase)